MDRKNTLSSMCEDQDSIPRPAKQTSQAHSPCLAPGYISPSLHVPWGFCVCGSMGAQQAPFSGLCV